MSETTTSQTPALWLRNFHPGDADLPVMLCLPHAGAAANFYRELSGLLAGRVQVLGMQYPGRQDRLAETPLTQMDDLAELVMPILLEALTDRRFLLFGHSMGASFAFELAQRLERVGLAPAALIASGRRAPSIPVTEYVHLRDDAGLIAEVNRFDEATGQALNSPVVQRMVLPSLRADYTANETYLRTTEHRLSCPIIAITGDSDPVTSVPDARMWQAHTSADFHAEVFAGGHFFLTDQWPAIAGFAESALRPGPALPFLAGIDAS